MLLIGRKADDDSEMRERGIERVRGKFEVRVGEKE